MIQVIHEYKGNTFLLVDGATKEDYIKLKELGWHDIERGGEVGLIHLLESNGALFKDYTFPASVGFMSVTHSLHSLFDLHGLSHNSEIFVKK